MRRLVVKLGGSAAGRDDMRGWIDCLATATFPLVIVPGGGPFADHIRLQQKRLHFSNDAAHDMAILSMEQFGLLIIERHPRLRPARTHEAIEEMLDAGHVPVWLPAEMTRDVPDIPRSWEVTSDSLAAWLCGGIGAEDLLLIKQTDIGAAAKLDELVGAGMVDSSLPQMLPGGVALHIAGPSDLRLIADHQRLSSVPGHAVQTKMFEGTSFA